MTNSSTSSNSASGNNASARRFRWPGALGLVVSVVLIWWTLHDVRLVEVWDHIRNVRWIPFLGAIALATLTFPLRTVRWQYLLRLEGATLSFVPLWHATAIGFMATNLLPARAGELARAYAAKRLTGSRFTTAFGSIAIERVFDGVTLVALLAVATWAGGFGTETSVGNVTLGEISRAAAILFLITLGAAVAVVHWPRAALAASRAVSRFLLPETWAARVVHAVEGLLSGLDALRSAGRFAAVLAWSLVVWLAAAASYSLAFYAFGVQVPWSAALMLQALLAFGVAVQFSPGFFGQWEAVCRVTLALYAVAPTKAVSLAIGVHIGGFIPITILGLWSLSRAHLHLADLRTTQEDNEAT